MKDDSRLIAFERLLQIMDDLREKCPWDMKQTNDSLRQLTIEEVYELSDAILSKNSKEIKEELGDILLHIVFYAKIGSETNDFDIESVLNSICDKLISRHPHIYGDTIADTEEVVKKNWEKLKLKEGRSSILGGVPQSLPSITKAYRIQEKAKQVGFEWENIQDVWNKVEEELDELKVATDNKDILQVEEEFGDLMFSLINYSRFLKIDPDTALEKCNRKFIFRFKYIEEKAKELNLPLEEMSLEVMDKYWNEAKLLSK
jgi:XTP/dITP diphosphohydrolase